MNELVERLVVLEGAAKRGGKQFDRFTKWMLGVVTGAVTLLLIPSVMGLVWLARLGVVAERTDKDLAAHLDTSEVLIQDYLATRGLLTARIEDLGGRVDRLEDR